MAFASRLIGGARKSATQRGLTPEEQAMLQGMQPDLQPVMQQFRPAPSPPMGMPSARPLIGGSMPQPKPQQPAKRPSMWDGIAQDPLAFLLRGADGVAERQDAEAKRAAMEAEQQRMMEMAQAAGLDPGAMLAMYANPEKFGESYAKNYEAANVNAGDSRVYGNGTQAYRAPQNLMSVSKDASVFDPNTGKSTYTNTAPPEPRYFNTRQAVVEVGPDRKANVLYRDPQQPGAGGLGFQSLSPEQVKARGYAPGTVVQVDSRGKEYVTGRPSAQQTGQPSEGERSAALHAQISMHGLGNIMQMEGRGYNRAGMSEQAGGLVGGENERLYDQAADEFIDGYLRAMTGAAATPSEIAQYRGQWFAKFGDSPAVLKQKAQGRLEALKAMKSKVGRAWKPEWDASVASLDKLAGPMSREKAASSPYLQGFSPEMQKAMLDRMPPSSPQANDLTDETFIDSLFPDEDGNGVPDGVDPEDWNALTPEEQQQYLAAGQ